MYKISIIVALFLSGCSNFQVTGTMCDNINTEPGAIIPKECRPYNKLKADKAFNKTRNEKLHSNEDIIKFSKEADDN